MRAALLKFLFPLIIFAQQNSPARDIDVAPKKILCEEMFELDLADLCDTVNFWQALPSFNGRDIIILKNGTEFHRADSATSQKFQQQHPDFFSQKGSRQKDDYREAFSKQSPNWSWVSFDFSLKNPNFALSQGLRINTSFENSPPYLINFVWNINYSKNVAFLNFGDFFNFNAGLSLTKERNINQRIIRDSLGQKFFSDYGFNFSVSIPFFRYAFEIGQPTLPEYFWLDPDFNKLTSKAINGRDSSGRVLSMFKNMSGHAAATIHSVELRWWALRYRAIFAPELYTNTVHWFGLKNLPIGSTASWGTHFILCNGEIASGIDIDLGYYKIFQSEFWGNDNSFIINPLNLTFDYKNVEQFKIKASVGLMWRVY